jgi:hypothetical protein
VAGEIYTPTYLVHPETKRIVESKGLRIELDPVVAESEMRAYKREFLDKRPLGENQEITSKIQSVYRIRSRDHRNEHLMWTERQTFTDQLGNEVSFTRNFCGKFKIPKFDGKAKPDDEGKIKTDFTIKGWIELYEIPWNWENCKRIKELAEDEFTLQTYIQTEGSEDVYTIQPEDFDKWAKWSFESLIDYWYHPEKFGKQIKQEKKKDSPPEMTKNELFAKKEQKISAT